MTFEHNDGIWTTRPGYLCPEYVARIESDDTFRERLDEIEEALREEVAKKFVNIPNLPAKVNVIFTTFPITFTFSLPR